VRLRCRLHRPRRANGSGSGRALKNRHQRFVIDGEAVVLDADGIADFNALQSRRHDDKVWLYAFVRQASAVGSDRDAHRPAAKISRP
jgi:hypothetical protein